MFTAKLSDKLHHRRGASSQEKGATISASFYRKQITNILLAQSEILHTLNHREMAIMAGQAIA